MTEYIGPIGFIGVGTMGFPMASRLLDRGFALVVHDLDDTRVHGLVDRGAHGATSPREVGAACRYVITRLPSSPHVEEVLAGAASSSWRSPQTQPRWASSAHVVLVGASTSRSQRDAAAVSAQLHEREVGDIATGREPHAFKRLDERDEVRECAQP